MIILIEKTINLFKISKRGKIFINLIQKVQDLPNITAISKIQFG